MEGLDQDAELIRALVEHAGTHAAGVAKKAGIAPSTLQRPLNGTATTRLSQRTIEKLMQAFPRFVGWDGQFSMVETDGSDPMVEVAEIDLRLGLGGVVMDQEVMDGQAVTRDFPLAWLRQLTTRDPRHLFWARGQGNSMEPLIGDGEVILIDRSQTSLLVGDLCWAFAYGQIAMIKRLRPMPDGSVKILSDNPNVAPETAYDGELTIFGRVIGAWKTI